MAVREAIVSGRFYEGDAQALCNYVQASLDEAERLLANSHTQIPANLLFLPHAGHFFCGHVIAKTLAHVQLPKNLILLGPNHTGQGEALAVWDTGHWQTPLGKIPVNTALAKDIIQSDGGFCSDTKAHLHEHSLEVILPFLQLKVPDMNIVPIAVGGRSYEAFKKAGLALGSIINNYKKAGIDVGIILSSDLHHFSDHDTTMALDEMALQAFLQFNPLKLAQVVGEYNISMCGVCPAIVSLYALENTNEKYECSLCEHTTSFEKNSDSKSVVGYAGLFVNKITCNVNSKHVY